MGGIPPQGAGPTMPGPLPLGAPTAPLPGAAQWQQPAPVPVSAAPAGPVTPQTPGGPTVESPEPDTTSATDEGPRRRRRSLTLPDDGDAMQDVLDMVQHVRDERIPWMDQRLVRYAKLRGWRQEETYPWEGAHNEHIPMIMANSLRIQAGIFNAVLGNHPIMQGRALRKDLIEAADKASQLIEFQFMQEADGEQKLGQAVEQFVNDGTIISFQPWVKDSRRMIDVRVVKGPTMDPMTGVQTHLIEYLNTVLVDILGDQLKSLRVEDEEGYHWSGRWADQEGKEEDVEIEVWDRDDGKLDIEIRWEQVTFDGPTSIIHQLEDIIVPLRALNMQPVTPQNPYGAPWVARRLRVNLDLIERRRKNGTYDLLTDDDMDDVVSFARTRTEPDKAWQGEDSVKVEKEARAGLMTDWSDLDEERKWIDLIEWYGSYTLSDGYECEIVLHVLDVPGGKLARARYLSEICPGSPQWRPFAEERFIPVADAFYGIGVPELLEGLHDLTHELYNSNLDRGDIANLPVVLYRASSGVKPEQMRVAPGDWVPVDNPKEDAVPMQYPHADQTWSFNMIGLVSQQAEKLIQIGSLQFGQVPQGKASALRTVGTTMAILQQGAALPEQILRRFFHWLQQVYGQFHMMNMKFLPEKKRYLIAGKDPDTDAAYGELGPQELQFPIAFDFGATLLNTNKGIVSQALSEIGSAIFTPLAMQYGITGPEQFYQWCKDKINAAQLDPQRYIKRPPGMPDTPPMSANDAIVMLVSGRMPPGTNFVEGPIEAFQTLAQWYQSDNFGHVHPTNLGIVREFMQRVQQAAQQAQMQQMAVQAAQQFQQALGQGQGGGGGSMPGEPPEMQTEPATQSEINGAGTQGPPGSKHA